MRPSNPVTIAEEAVSAYIGASFNREYSSDCNVNPEALSDAVLGQRLGDAFTEMMNALAALKDDDAAGVLDRVQQRDHDGSLFAVVTLDYVREQRVANSPAMLANAPERPPSERTTGNPPKPRTCAQE